MGNKDIEKDASLEGKMERLSEIAAEMENEETTLDRAMELFKEGMDLGIKLSEELSLKKGEMEELSKEATLAIDSLEE